MRKKHSKGASGVLLSLSLEREIEPPLEDDDVPLSVQPRAFRILCTATFPSGEAAFKKSFLDKEEE